MVTDHVQFYIPDRLPLSAFTEEKLKQDLEKILRTVKTYNPNPNDQLIRDAFEFAKKAHDGQKRSSGEPFIFHPVATAQRLADLHLDSATIAAGLLHDVDEDTDYSIADIKEKFGEEVAKLVEGITVLDKIKYRGISRYAENLQKMFISMANDIRTIFIKFADRMHNLETLDSLPRDKQLRIAKESLAIYAPIANRLGMGQIQGELESLSFRYLAPDEFSWLQGILPKQYAVREKVLIKVRDELAESLRNEGIKPVIMEGRAKQLYSLYKKLQSHNREINKIYDVIALRVIVEDISTCYKVLGIIHKHWKPMKGRIKDYIAVPKPNGYQSLHTTIFANRGELAEIQIRTSQMHEQAEYGIAAHWRYKEPGSYTIPKNFQWIDELVDIKKTIGNNHHEYLSKIKLDFFQDRIFVFTPKGDVINLPEDATPIDFAYSVHTELGRQMEASKVNDQMSRLDRPLKNGDMVEIIRNKNKKSPNPDWLKIAKTQSARAKIRAQLRTGGRLTHVEEFLQRWQSK